LIEQGHKSPIARSYSQTLRLGRRKAWSELYCIIPRICILTYKRTHLLQKWRLIISLY